MKKRALFIDRDGTLIEEPKPSLQVDNLDQLVFLPKVIRNLYFIRKKLDFEFIMVSNQDGLGTDAYPTENFERVQNKMLQILQNEGICFDAIHIDPSLPEQNSPGRKPGTAMLTSYMDGSYDLAASFVIGDRMTDVQLAHNLGCKCILLNEEINLQESKEYAASCVMQSTDWDKISAFLFAGQRKVSIERKTKETEVKLELDLDGSGKTNINTGIKFFDHMLEQIGRHSGCDLSIIVKGDLEVDEHHTVEDTALVLGEALRQALGDKRGIERYGYCLPMDDSLCSLALDFGGRPWMVWDVNFRREKLGELPTELIFHFFKSLSDSAKMNLNIKALGDNEHHK